MSALPAPVEVFYSYADADEDLCIELDRHLSLLVREGLIALWHKRQITPGMNWAEVLDHHLNVASVILLLISSDFLASDYCYGTEMQRAMERYGTNEVHIIPILLRPVDWQSAPFGRLKALPSNGRPVTSWPNRDEAFVDIAQGIRTALLNALHLENGNTFNAFPRGGNICCKDEKRDGSAKDGGSTHQTHHEQPVHIIHETIDTDEVIQLFCQCLDTSSTIRVLCIVGESKLGKTHLLTKVFPALAQQECQARYAIIDLRDRMHTIPDILSLTSSQIDEKYRTNYQKAYRTWTSQSKVSIEHVFLLLSSLTRSTKQEEHDLHKSEFNLTTEFIKDLAACNDRPLLLFIDHIDNAMEKVQAWLINTFLVQASLLAHVRVVIAGRSVPEPHGRYAACCLRYQLRPVTEEEAYITYCQRNNVRMLETSVRDFAFCVDHRPGMFVELVVPRFQQRR